MASVPGPSTKKRGGAAAHGRTSATTVAATASRRMASDSTRSAIARNYARWLAAAIARSTRRPPNPRSRRWCVIPPSAVAMKAPSARVARTSVRCARPGGWVPARRTSARAAARRARSRRSSGRGALPGTSRLASVASRQSTAASPSRASCVQKPPTQPSSVQGSPSSHAWGTPATQATGEASVVEVGGSARPVGSSVVVVVTAVVEVAGSVTVVVAVVVVVVVVVVVAPSTVVVVVMVVVVVVRVVVVEVEVDVDTVVLVVVVEGASVVVVGPWSAKRYAAPLPPPANQAPTSTLWPTNATAAPNWSPAAGAGSANVQRGVGLAASKRKTDPASGTLPAFANGAATSAVVPASATAAPKRESRRPAGGRKVWRSVPEARSKR